MPHIDENKVLRDALSGLNAETPPMPEGLHAAWLKKVEDDMEDKRTEKNLNRRASTRFLSIAAALVFVVGGTLLTRDDLAERARMEKQYDSVAAQNAAATWRAGTADNYDAKLESYEEDYISTTGTATFTMARGASLAPQAENGVATAAASKRSTGAEAAVEAPAATEKKIIRTAGLTLNTPDYDASLANLRAMCEASGGWIESVNENLNSAGTRRAYLTLRIPQEKLDDFLAGTADCGRVTSRHETATDVTAAYQDTQVRLDTQLALMDRLQALIPESASLSDLLALESQIADTQYQIDTLTSSLAETDRQVSYATVSINLYEETTPSLTDTSVSLGERLSAGLRLGCEAILDFAQDMLVFIVAALPFIGIAAAVVILVIVIRHIRRRNEK